MYMKHNTNNFFQIIKTFKTECNYSKFFQHLHVQGHPYLNHLSQIYGPSRRNLVSDRLCESDAWCHLEFLGETMQSLKKMQRHSLKNCKCKKQEYANKNLSTEILFFTWYFCERISKIHFFIIL